MTRYLPLGFGLVVLAAFYLTPFFFSYNHTSNGAVWVPVPDYQHRCSDSIFYSATVIEAQDHFFRYANPVGANVGALWIDALRSSSSRLGAILTFGINDARLGLLSSQLLCLLLLGVLVFWFGRILGLTSAWACLLMLWFIFGASIISNPKGVNDFIKIFIKQSEIVSAEQVNDLFRFTVMQAAAPFFLLYTISLIIFFRSPNFATAIAHGVALFLVAFSYYPLAMLAFLLSFVVGIFEKFWKREKIWHWITVTAVVIVLFLLSNLWGIIVNVISNPHYIVSQAHFSEKTNTHGFGYAFILLAFLLSLSWLNIPKDLKLLARGVIVSILLIFLASVIVDKPYAMARSFGRGFAMPLWLIICAVLLSFLQFKLMRHSRLVVVLLLVTTSVLIVYRSVTIGHAASKNAVFEASEDFWNFTRLQVSDLYGPPLEVAALDVEDNQLLPIYSRAYLYFADPNFAHVSYDENLKRFLRTLKILKIERATLGQWVDSYSKNDMNFKCFESLENRKKSHKMDLLLRQLLYANYVKIALGLNIRDAQGLLVSAQFKEHFLKAFDSVEERANPPDVIITNEEIEGVRVGAGAPDGYRLDQGSRGRTIYRRNSEN